MLLIQRGGRLPGVTGNTLSSFGDMQLASECYILGRGEKLKSKGVKYSIRWAC